MRKWIAALLLSLLPALALAGDFVTNPSAPVFDDKVAGQSLPTGANPANYIRASDINMLKAWDLDLRDAVWALQAGAGGGASSLVDQGAAGTSPWLVNVQNLGQQGLGQTTMANSPSVNIASDQTPVKVDRKPAGAVDFQCSVPATSTAATQCAAAPGAGLYFYITHVTLGNGPTPQTIQVIAGTGTNCATGTSPVAFAKSFNANSGVSENFDPSYAWKSPTANAALCVTPGGGASFGADIRGYIAQ